MKKIKQLNIKDNVKVQVIQSNPNNPCFSKMSKSKACRNGTNAKVFKQCLKMFNKC